MQALRPTARLGGARPRAAQGAWRPPLGAPTARRLRPALIRAQRHSGALPPEESSQPFCYSQQQQQQAGPEQSRRSDPEKTLQSVLDLVKAGDLDGLVEFVADEVIDTVVEARKTSG